ncbi:MAG: 4Fe-4S binding protein [Candidatus Thermoplasmatota archaeon]|nr:4Fe-4S binding protein [Candidatus Thermoplasmatota archaeon]
MRPELDYDSCIRCMICWKFCPDNAIRVEPGDAFSAPNERVAGMEAPFIDMDYCKGCGICASECPEKCIDLVLETRRVE